MFSRIWQAGGKPVHPASQSRIQQSAAAFYAKVSEDAAAAIFDANGDGNADLRGEWWLS
jgi:hypothetical protein